MAMNILLAYDGSEGAKAALADLVNVGIGPGSSITVLTVAEYGMIGAGESDIATTDLSVKGEEALTLMIREAIGRAEELSLEAKKGINQLFPSLSVDSDFAVGTPANAILQKANAISADLIVLGSHGRGLFSRLFLGSVSLRVLHAAACSVRIVKSMATSPDPFRIVLAVDGSRDSDAMLTAVGSRVWVKAPEFTLINVDDLALMLSVHGVGIQMISKESEGRSETILADAAKRLSSAEIKARTISRIGNPVQTIIDEAQVEGAYAIYMGAKGHGTLERVFLGSVSHGIAIRFTGVIEVIR